MIHGDDRLARAGEAPIVDGLPDLPGITVAMNLSPQVGVHLRGLANALLVDAFPGSTLSRGERELIATTVSSGNDCFFCMDSHAAFAAELLRREDRHDAGVLADAARNGAFDLLDGRMSALAAIARQVGRNPRDLMKADIDIARTAGASDGDVQVTVLIAAAFCMYNRMVDGLRAKTFPDTSVYDERARAIADHGYEAAGGLPVPAAG